MLNDSLEVVDKEIFDAIQKEHKRQNEKIELIASENFASKAVMEAMGSVFTNKYAEGYPGKRYYGGCQNVDVAENLARDRAKEIFGAEHDQIAENRNFGQKQILSYIDLRTGARKRF